MNVTLFLFVMALVVVSQCAILYLSLRRVSTVKAGNVLKYCPATKCRVGSKPRQIQVNGAYVDVSSLEQLVVCGNSMHDYRINNGQTVFVSRINDKESISTHPVVVFNITNAPSHQSKYKLRKMVSYAEGYDQDWNVIYRENNNRIRISQNDFVTMCQNKVKKMQEAGIVNERFIVSETYDEDLHEYRYSLHPVSTLYAKVKYVA
ncbi:MAG: hypothetical protein MJZ20_13550 [Bacteroidaceae bacterium]|nr:hypothetical protein [Bacteroidaceae bacterium]